MAEKLTINVAALSAASRRTLATLKRPVMDAARQFGAVREKLTDLAPRVVKLFNAISAEHDVFTFVDFVRLFDATVPAHAADRDGVTGYRNHRTYYTLAYMRRIVQTAGRNAGRRTQQGVRDSATDALARTLATILQVVRDDDAPQVWNAIKSEFQFSERLMTRLRKRVDATEPLLNIKIATPATVGKVIHMERPQTETTAKATPATPHARVSLPEATSRRARAKAA